MTHRRPRTGATLLEAIVALSILVTGGIAAVTVSHTAAHAVAIVRANDRALARATELFDAVALWSPEDLDRHLGARLQGAWRMNIHKSGAMYRVVLTDTATMRVLLETSLYRPMDRRAAE